MFDKGVNCVSGCPKWRPLTEKVGKQTYGKTVLKSFVKKTTGHAKLKMDSKRTAGLRTFHFKSSLLKQAKEDFIVLASSKLMKTQGHLVQELYGAKRRPR